MNKERDKPEEDGFSIKPYYGALEALSIES
jgi:hypothetical protein